MLKNTKQEFGYLDNYKIIFTIGVGASCKVKLG